jgi:26S proteasome regulatory subunit N13
VVQITGTQQDDGSAHLERTKTEIKNKNLLCGVVLFLRYFFLQEERRDIEEKISIITFVWHCCPQVHLMQQSLFPQGANGRQAAKPIVSFKAGKCAMVLQPEGDFLVTPEDKKGLVTLSKENDGLIHFRWTDRTAKAIIDDLIVFPDDVQFKRVNTGRDGDRVYMLKWRIGDRRIMFWMQNKSPSEDSDNCAKINAHINNPNAGAEAAGGGDDAWMRMLRPGRGQPTQQAPAASASQPSNAFGLDLGRIIQGIQTSGSAPQSSVPAAGPGGAAPRPTSTSLRGVLNPDAIIATGILGDPVVRQNLIALLPEGQQTEEALDDTLRSPQLQQAVDVLAHALHSDNFNSVLANLGIDPAPGMAHLMRGDAVGAFLAAASAAGRAITDGSVSEDSKESESKQGGNMDESS